MALYNLIVILLLVASFSAGVWLADWFNTRARAEQKEALEKQYLRLRSGSDADDPVKPYKYFPAEAAPQAAPPEYITPQFMEELRSTGKARTEFRKGDIAS